MVDEVLLAMVNEVLLAMVDEVILTMVDELMRCSLQWLIHSIPHPSKKTN